MPMQGRRVYVTGATGFIGGVVVKHLLKQGAHVTALVRPKTDAAALERAGVTVVRGDVTEPATLNLSDQDVVVHAAAWVGFGIPRGKLDLFRKTNIGGTENVVHAAEQAGVAKLVHVSSIAALGAPEKMPATEETLRATFYKSEYERTKTEAHAIAMKAKIPTVLPMPGLVLGLGGPFDWLLERLARGGPVALPADDAVKGWVHVEDVAEGIVAAIQRGRGPYLMVDENLRLTELVVRALEEAALPIPRARVPVGLLRVGAWGVEKAYHLAGKTPPISDEMLRALPLAMSYDSAKARKELAWRPELVSRLARDLQTLARR